MYRPSNVPADPSEIPAFLRTELERLARYITSAQPFLYLSTSHAAPTRPQEGMVVKADGTDWNPGAGAGFYGYKAGSWVLLG